MVTRQEAWGVKSSLVLFQVGVLESTIGGLLDGVVGRIASDCTHDAEGGRDGGEAVGGENAFCSKGFEEFMDEGKQSCA